MDRKPGLNRIEISLDKEEFSPGEKLTGTVRLHLNKPTPARGLHVSFFGTSEVLGNEGINENYAVAAKISGRRAYSTYELHSFELVLPTNLPATKNYNYYAKAWLDMPVRLDVLKVVKVELAHANGAASAKGEMRFLTMFTVCSLSLFLTYTTLGMSFSFFMIVLLVLIAVGLFYELYIAKRRPSVA